MGLNPLSLSDVRNSPSLLLFWLSFPKGICVCRCLSHPYRLFT
ncbi:hypothetical protein GRAN_4008 [Granulicella sibirica]|uniref:Uncharacterized protein n=1 Tax=Granulicella sibirica TaxID=2479048 RepID=A0A4V1L587_9BACT|nr:hypothetical protein GRAN_4008 [Granulicella sibirica]